MVIHRVVIDLAVERITADSDQVRRKNEQNQDCLMVWNAK